MVSLDWREILKFSSLYFTYFASELSTLGATTWESYLILNICTNKASLERDKRAQQTSIKQVFITIISFLLILFKFFLKSTNEWVHIVDSAHIWMNFTFTYSGKTNTLEIACCCSWNCCLSRVVLLYSFHIKEANKVCFSNCVTRVNKRATQQTPTTRIPSKLNHLESFEYNQIWFIICQAHGQEMQILEPLWRALIGSCRVQCHNILFISTDAVV